MKIVYKKKMFKDLNINVEDITYIQDVLMVGHVSNINTNHILIFVGNEIADDKYRLLSMAIDNYYEYIEFQETRRNAVDARIYSIWAIIIATASLILACVDILLNITRLQIVLDSSLFASYYQHLTTPF